MLVNAPGDQKRDFNHIVEVFTAGAPPAPATLAKIEPMGFNVTQVYGLTEVYGPATECTWDSAWDDLGTDERAAIKARQGVAMPFMEDVAVWDSAGQQISRDGTAQGEIVMRGNGTMKGITKTHRPLPKRLRADISIRVISLCTTQIPMFKSQTVPRTSSFQGAKTSVRLRSKAH